MSTQLIAVKRCDPIARQPYRRRIEDTQMSELKPPHDPIEALGQAYEEVLEKALEEAHRLEERGAPRLHKIIDTLRHDAKLLGKLSEEQAEKIGQYLKRDLEDAARFLSETGRELQEWWGFDRILLEKRLLENFTKAADQTTVELELLQDAAQKAPYKTGEITGPGTLLCDNCGEVLHFHKPGHIPPCPKCRKTQYHRPPIE